MKHIMTYNQLNEADESYARFDVAQTLITMLEGDDVDFEPLEPDDETWKKIGLPEFGLNPPDDVESFVDQLPEKKFKELQKALTENGFLNEGWLTKIKDWLFKKIYKVNYTVELTDVKTDEPVSYKSYLTVKAKDEDTAEEKFYDKWNDTTKNLDVKPKVILGNIKKTRHADKIDFDLPRTLKKPQGFKEVTKKVDMKKKEEPKKEEPKKKEELKKVEKKDKK
jgi:hypothetical protein